MWSYKLQDVYATSWQDMEATRKNYDGQLVRSRDSKPFRLLNLSFDGPKGLKSRHLGWFCGSQGMLTEHICVPAPAR